MEKQLVENLFAYTLFLIVVDLFMNIILNLVQGNPGGVIAVYAIVRIFFLLIFFPLLGYLIFFLLKNKGHYIALFITTIAVYLILPSVVYLLKSNNKTLLEVYIELHVKSDLFVIIFLPYILASFICLIVSNKIRLFK